MKGKGTKNRSYEMRSKTTEIPQALKDHYTDKLGRKDDWETHTDNKNHIKRKWRTNRKYTKPDKN